MFTVLTDHRNLLQLHKSIVPKAVRWRLALQPYTFDTAFGMSKVAPITSLTRFLGCMGALGRKRSLAVRCSRDRVRRN